MRGTGIKITDCRVKAESNLYALNSQDNIKNEHNPKKKEF